MSITFPNNLDTLTNPSSTDTLDSPSHAGQHSDINDAVEALEAKVGADSSAVTTSLDYQIGAGWIPAEETWTYASADDPTYNIYAAGDVIGKYSAGMRFKCTDTGTQQFILTLVGSYDGVNDRTPLTLYGGTDYDLSGGAITNPYYSMVKAPQGFPLDPSKWSVTGSGASGQDSPASGTTYNIGGSINIPIGVWEIAVDGDLVMGNFTSPATYIYTEYGLGTTTSDTALVEFTNRLYLASGTLNRNGFDFSFNYRCNLSTKDTYYLNAEITYSGSALNLSLIPVTFRATCAYL